MHRPGRRLYPIFAFTPFSMHSSPKVSVIIPCYNQGIYVDDAVDSVLAQSCQNFEIIIVNDGSSDEFTNQLLGTYSKAKTRVVSTDNQGLAAARNNGISEARGEYILPLDADDRIGPTYLEQAVRILEQSPDIGIVYCRARLFGELESEWILPEYSLDNMLLDNVIFCSSFFRRSQWQAVGGYDPAMVHGWEDWDFWLSLIEQGALVHKIPEILFHYRITADSMVRSKQKEQKVETLEKIYHKHPRLFSDNIQIWIDKLLDRPEESLVTRLYVDTGDGYNEAQTLTQKLDPLTRSISFDVTGFRNVRGLRFHPVNDYCAIHLSRVELSSETGYSIVLEEFQANTIDNNSVNLVFNDNTPYVDYQFPDACFYTNRIARFSVTLNFLRIGKEAFFYLLQRKDQLLEQQQQELAACRGELARHRSVEFDQPAVSLSWQGLARLSARKLLYTLVKARFMLQRPYRAIVRSGLFDADYYLRENPDLQSSLIDPVIHYLQYGYSEGRDPNPLFATWWYRRRYPESAEQGINPLYHYIAQGWQQGNNPCPMFETAYYLRSYPQVRASGANPLAHYLQEGAVQGYNPNPLFDGAYYLEQNPDVAASGENPLVHFLRSGVWEGRATCQVEDNFISRPTISILVPVYNVPARYLRACIESVLAQSYEHWELCLVDDASPADHVRPLLAEYSELDARIRVSYLPGNQGIAGATNAAAELATGSYYAFLDNDDELTRDALLEVVRTINLQEAEIIYSDECIVDPEGAFQEAHHKPDFSPDLLLCHNYITHFLVLRAELFQRVGGLSSSCDGAQDYDLLLKVSEQSERIVHIPKVLYRWRSLETSTSGNPGAKSYADRAGKLALESALERRGLQGEVFYGNLPFYYRLRRELTARPLVSILIPFSDQPELLKGCIQAIRERSHYPHYEIIGISNNSSQAETFELMEQLATRDGQVRFVEYNQPFNYSAINNFGVSQARGEQLVLMNNDIEVINLDWLEAMLEHSQRPEVGAVGAKLYYPDDTIQHAGVIIGIGGFAGHGHRQFPRDSAGYFNRLFCIQNLSAVTAALLMVKRSCYEQVGGLDETHFGVALNDVDFCLKLRAQGFLNIWTPYAEAYHHESASRGYEDTPEKKARFQREVGFFQEKWQELLQAGDPYFNPNFSLEREDYAVKRNLSWCKDPATREELLKGEAGQG
ncbi:glycosyltransferase [Desulfogranum mediterraneum]|uniref:glycosyltransferase n=1 Tax=Desulfogranum mediterraneum TaxID=160661 RepID=UPI000684631D|nr:glycosyltransferase [Desulfogranum mediterraneum]